jgi:S-adenosylmethionine-diacylglycerol 3-amino-3-carboxypropyl transferase
MVYNKAFFKYLDRSFSFGKHFALRAKHALTELPTKENYFLAYILLGNYYDENSLPPYLRRENYETIRNRINRIQVITDSCEHFFSVLPDCCISKFNFTNIFEWMSPETFTDLLKQTIRVARDGAVITYRNLLVFRERPASLANRIRCQREFARSLYERDLSFMYSNYVVEEIHKEEKQ